MKRIAIAQAKGGVGKTTTAINLAAGLARLGRKVLLCDCDTQDQVLPFLGVADVKNSLATYVLGKTTLEATAVEARENLWVMRGGSDLVTLKNALSALQKRDAKLHAVEKRFTFPDSIILEYVIFDCAPGWDILSANILWAADVVLAPASVEWATVRGIQTFLAYVEGVYKERRRQDKGKSFSFFILPTIYDRRVSKSRRVLDTITAKYPRAILQPIRYNSRLSEAFEQGQTIFEHSPRSKGAEDYSALTSWCLKLEKPGTV